ncbi:Hypothetical protein PBC10988_9980 [Planctomycetales bacterium 10988]|nr:Hypothetical protein PBC10988_9980 [Planctomycetales bacterium 10988]
MRKTFQSKPQESALYAVTDALNTYLIHKEMKRQDREIYQFFHIDCSKIPEMAATIGGRIKDFLITMTQEFVKTSKTLSDRKSINSLMLKGSILQLSYRQKKSRFGPQTGLVHGGLLYSRSPTCFWHEAPGMLRDVDLKGCYNSILCHLNVYWGQPVVLEPGSKKMSLADAVQLAQELADSDAWFIRVTGDLSNFPNTLIPSSLDPVTSDNYRSCLEITKQQKFQQAPSQDWIGGSKLFSDRIESGIVSDSTWRVIQTLPRTARLEYEKLIAENIVYYPRKFIATSAEEYDQKRQDFGSDKLPWHSTFDAENDQLIHRESLDQDYISLRFPIHEYATQIAQERQKAIHKEGKGSCRELAWKVQANSMYGVIASRCYVTNNFVAANVITSQGRSLAYVMMQSLNGIQVITDGCTYRKDRIPACTFAECLQQMPDYPLRHADEDSGIPFLDPKDVPDSDESFTTWYRKHVVRFFEIKGDSLDSLLQIHELEHKKTGKTDNIGFDAMTCDGSGNYMKLLKEGNNWSVQESKMRGHKPEGKEDLKAWIIETFSKDTFRELPPISKEKNLLKLEPAKQKAKKALLQTDNNSVFLPLCLESESVHSYKVIKNSAFVFKTPKQRNLLLRRWEKFNQLTGCGLELIALRRSHTDRQQYSIQSLSELIYKYIRSGRQDFTKDFNLTEKRLEDTLMKIVKQRKMQLRKLKEHADQELFQQIVRELETEDLVVTGILIDPETYHLVRS